MQAEQLKRWIKRFFLTVAATIAMLFLLVALLLIWPLPDMPREGQPGDFSIRDVAVVDVAAGSLRYVEQVIVRNGVIISIGDAAAETPGGPLIEIDGTGRYLLPGLWDMHTHSNKFSARYQHPLFIANGITAVRELWGCMSEPDSFFACPDDREAWNLGLSNNSGLSPRYIGQSSFQINGGSEVPQGYPAFFNARTTDEVDALVDYYASVGVDFLKPYTSLSRESYQALAAAARKRGLSLAGHRPIAVSLEEALSAEQKSIEHARLFLLECFSGADDFRALPDPLAAYTPALRARLIDEQDAQRCETLMAAMARSDTWWTPTLQTLRMGAMAGNAEFREDSRLDYVPLLFRKLMWKPDADAKAATAIDETGRDVYAAMYAVALQHVGQAHAAGVKILAGTDTFDTYVFPGSSLHDELAELVAAGLSPAAALRSATLDAATFSGLEDRYGSIEEGKLADMLLLGANPLTDIGNTQRIDGVFFNGQFFDRAALDNLLQFARDRANSIHNNLHILWAAIRSPLLRVQFAD